MNKRKQDDEVEVTPKRTKMDEFDESVFENMSTEEMIDELYELCKTIFGENVMKDANKVFI